MKVFYFRERLFNPGIIALKTKMGTVKVYCREKTVCDMFRYRKKIGEDLAVEGLRNYLRLKVANLVLLQEYAVKCRVKTVIIPYIHALVG